MVAARLCVCWRRLVPAAGLTRERHCCHLPVFHSTNLSLSVSVIISVSLHRALPHTLLFLTSSAMKRN